MNNTMTTIRPQDKRESFTDIHFHWLRNNINHSASPISFFPIISRVIFPLLMVAATANALAGGDLPTKFSNIGGVINTRHNLTQSSIGPTESIMDQFRNDYGEVCVYCHTPHGANNNIDAPLWNRTSKNTTYTTYDTIGTSTLTENVTAPGVNSITCLSCHDGTIAIDSIVNMPGSGLYSVAQKTSVNEAFLDSWSGNGNFFGSAQQHATLGPRPGFGVFACMTCHESGSGSNSATDFTAFLIGTDLTDDHPVGIQVPTTRYGDDFVEPTGSYKNMLYYETNGDDRPGAEEIRFYDTGEGPEVECASCHDPHGVRPSGGHSLPSFLRVANTESKLCFTCHNK